MQTLRGDDVQLTAGNGEESDVVVAGGHCKPASPNRNTFALLTRRQFNLKYFIFVFFLFLVHFFNLVLHIYPVHFIRTKCALLVFLPKNIFL